VLKVRNINAYEFIPTHKKRPEGLLNKQITNIMKRGWLDSCIPTRGGHFYSLEKHLCLRPDW
jgi:hypothetical protein